jgi:hypothetical protein
MWTPETWIHGAEFLMLLAGGWIGLKIKDAVSGVREEQSKVKAELIASQTEMRTDMDAKHAENQANIRSHEASDEQQFKYINGSLERIENKIEQRNRSRV